MHKKKKIQHCLQKAFFSHSINVYVGRRRFLVHWTLRNEAVYHKSATAFWHFDTQDSSKYSRSSQSINKTVEEGVLHAMGHTKNGKKKNTTTVISLHSGDLNAGLEIYSWLLERFYAQTAWRKHGDRGNFPWWVKKWDIIFFSSTSSFFFLFFFLSLPP